MSVRERLRKWNEPKPVTVVDRWLFRAYMAMMAIALATLILSTMEWCIWRIVS